jgi:hypothetical protein
VEVLDLTKYEAAPPVLACMLRRKSDAVLGMDKPTLSGVPQH